MPLPNEKRQWPSIDELYAAVEKVQDPDWFQRLFMQVPSPTGRVLDRFELPQQDISRAHRYRESEEVTVVTVDYAEVECRILAHMEMKKAGD